MARIYQPVWNRLKSHGVVVLRLYPTANTARKDYNRIKKLITKEKYLDTSFTESYALARISFKFEQKDGIYYLRAELNKSINFSHLIEGDVC